MYTHFYAFINDFDLFNGLTPVNGPHVFTILLYVLGFQWLHISESILSHGVADIQWITSCHKNRMNTRVITLYRVDVTS